MTKAQKIDDQITRMNRGKTRAKKRQIQPEDAESMVLALKAGRLDNRLSAAKDLKSMRELIGQQSVIACRGMILDCTAIQAVILGTLMKTVTARHEALVDADGVVDQMLLKTLNSTQNSIISASDALLRIDSHIRNEKMNNSIKEVMARNDIADISTMILDSYAPKQQS